MNTEDWIVMGVLIILFGGLMVARHFINNIPTDRPHSLPMTARPMATYSADSPLARDTEEEPSDYQLIPRMEDIEEIDKQMATTKRRIFAQDRRIAELEARHGCMAQNYEDLIETFKEREAAIEYRLDELEHRV
jgi:hypothetical protein